MSAVNAKWQYVRQSAAASNELTVALAGQSRSSIGIYSDGHLAQILPRFIYDVKRDARRIR